MCSVMKVITMYLPQFHRVKENDEWWGDGFTDWVAVRNAVSLYEGQELPIVPLNENYYDLLEKNVMKWQADLMHRYGIDGQCIYHYWFKDGRRILEKPAEQLLKWKDIDMPFCFCWANETWARSWSSLQKVNPWSDLLEPAKKDGASGVLLEQSYGDELQWKAHFDYLLPFFRDERYIRIDQRPVFMIYKAQDIPCLKQMVDYWQHLALKSGLEPVYFIGCNSMFPAAGSGVQMDAFHFIGCDNPIDEIVDATLYLPPTVTWHQVDTKFKNEIKVCDCEKFWKAGLDYVSFSKKTYYGGIVNFDDTPRRGRNGSSLTGMTAGGFQVYLSKLLAKNAANGNLVTFINAWNEWGETMYVEPDERHGYQLLEAVDYAKRHYSDYIDQFSAIQESRVKALFGELRKLQRKKDKYETYWRIFDAWMSAKEEKRTAGSWLESNGIKSIAIYGMGMLGKHLLRELKESKIKICYAIDHRKENIDVDIPVVGDNEEFEDVDMVIVTVVDGTDEVVRLLREKGFKKEKIVLLEDILIRGVLQSG